MTLFIATLGSAMLIFACPVGMPADDRTMCIAFSWGGVFFAQLVSLGAWTALRDGSWFTRLSIPAALLVTQMVACAVGERVNSVPTDGSSAVVSMGTFGSAYLVFLCFRRMGWRIGPRQESAVVYSLAQLFVAITFLGIALAIWAWSATDSRGHVALSLSPAFLLQGFGNLLGTFIGTLLFSLFAAPAIAVVMDGRMRYVIWLMSDLLILPAILVLGSFQLFGGTLKEIILPAIIVSIAFVLVTMWLFHALRICRYHFIGRQSQQPFRRRWFFVGVGLALTGIMFSAFSLSEYRAQNALTRPWMPLGVFPSGFQGSDFTGASFTRLSIGITRPGIEALKKQPLLRDLIVECAASPEQIGWLAELQTLEQLILSGKHHGDAHLRSLHQAKHLKRLELRDTSASIAEVRKLEKVLAGCEIRMINAGTAVVTRPVEAQGKVVAP